MAGFRRIKKICVLEALSGLIYIWKLNWNQQTFNIASVFSVVSFQLSEDSHIFEFGCLYIWMFCKHLERNCVDETRNEITDKLNIDWVGNSWSVCDDWLHSICATFWWYWNRLGSIRKIFKTLDCVHISACLHITKFAYNLNISDSYISYLALHCRRLPAKESSVVWHEQYIDCYCLFLHIDANHYNTQLLYDWNNGVGKAVLSQRHRSWERSRLVSRFFNGKPHK